MPTLFILYELVFGHPPLLFQVSGFRFTSCKALKMYIISLYSKNELAFSQIMCIFEEEALLGNRHCLFHFRYITYLSDGQIPQWLYQIYKFFHLRSYRFRLSFKPHSPGNNVGYSFITSTFLILLATQVSLSRRIGFIWKEDEFDAGIQAFIIFISHSPAISQHSH